MATRAQTEELTERWRSAWPGALAAWSSYTLLREPRFYTSDRAAAGSGMAGEIAAIGLSDHRVNVNLATIRKNGLEDHALAVLAHEVGHHIYVPGNLRDNARMIAAITRMLVGLKPRAAHLVANLYGDLMINDRLQRRANVDVAGVYRKLRQAKSTSAVWRVYTRAYEHLWRLAPGTLAPDRVSREQDADAQLVARIIRTFAGDWLRGARRFASVLYPWIARDEREKMKQTFEELGLGDTRRAGAPAPGEEDGGVIPDGLAEIDPSELGEDEGFDDEILDPLGEKKEKGGRPVEKERNEPSTGQYRRPFEYGQLLEALGLKLSAREVTARYYKERALPYLIPFPSRRAPQAVEPLAEGYETWAGGDPLEELDVAGSILASPVMIPGVTTVRRVYGESPGSDPARRPMDLDIYVDSSGSMPQPEVDVSYLALAGVILALSALRVGARVNATLWSGAGQFQTTGGFTRDETRILAIITGYLGDGTTFPLNVLRETYEKRTPSDPAAHIAVISDDGVDTMLQDDEKANHGADVVKRALEGARGGGTLVLNLGERTVFNRSDELASLGLRIHPVSAWEDLVAFARAFVRDNYGEGTKA